MAFLGCDSLPWQGCCPGEERVGGYANPRGDGAPI